MNPQSSAYSSANNHQTPSNRSQIAPSSVFRILTFTLYRRPVHFLPTPPNDPSTLTTLPVYTYVHLWTKGAGLSRVWCVCVCVCVCAQIRVSTITLSNHSAFSQVIGWKTHHTAPFACTLSAKIKYPFNSDFGAQQRPPQEKGDREEGSCYTLR